MHVMSRHVRTCSLGCLLGVSACFALTGARAQDKPEQPTAAPAAEQGPQTGAAPAPGAAAKKGKLPYAGPTEAVELPATPVLDAEGRQRLDPDGKPMFNAPVLQMRDKKGHPVFDGDGKPVFQTAKDMGFDAKGKKIAMHKEKPPKTVEVNIAHGTFTVDGLTGKAALNYEIKDLKYVYFYVPWIGTTVVSNVAFPGSKEQKEAFNDKTLTVTVGEHTLQLYSDVRLLGKRPEPAFVAVDRDFKLPTANPVFGYGASNRAPYDWPGAKQETYATKGAVVPPPIPENLRPTLLLAACPTGEMRMPGPKPLPGQTAAAQRCVPIAQAVAAYNATGPTGATQPASAGTSQAAGSVVPTGESTGAPQPVPASAPPQ